MHTITQTWYQPPGHHHRNPAPTPAPAIANPATQLDQTTAWSRIRAGTVLYRGTAAPFPVHLPFKLFGSLNDGSKAAVFELTVAERQLQAWVVPDRHSGAPRVVHAKGNIDKANELTFVDPFQNANTAAALANGVPTDHGGIAINLSPEQQHALLQALLQSTFNQASQHVNSKLPVRAHSVADWARAQGSQVTVWIPEIGRAMPMAYAHEGQLYNGRKALVFELRLHRLYRCLVAPSDRNGEPMVVGCSKPDERSQFSVE